MAEQEMVKEQQSEKELSELLQIRRDKLTALVEAGKDPFEITSYPVSDYAKDILENFVEPAEGEEGKTVRIAGRMMSRRIMGKASFAHLMDASGEIQVYVKRDDVGEENYNQGFKKWDIGDIIGIEGFVFRTKTGEGGRLFGSITSKDVAEALEKQLKIKVDKKKIQVPDSIKGIGSFTIVVKLHAKASAEMRLKVESNG